MIKFTQIKDYSKTPVINVSNKMLFENSNILHEPNDTGREYKIIICEHPIKVNGKPDTTHGTEKGVYYFSSDLIKWTRYGRIIGDFNAHLNGGKGDGLEDFSLVKANGKYVVACEHKPIGKPARNTVVFANSKIEDLKGADLVKTIKPKYWFDSHSVMSPTMLCIGNEIFIYYEGRYEPDLMKFQVGFIILNAVNYSIIHRQSKPIVDGYTIFDDIIDKQPDGYYYAVTHDFDESRPADSRWRGQIWRCESLNSGWTKWTDIKTTDGLYPMPQMLVENGKISFFYSLWRHFSGIRLAFPVYNEQPNGVDMKPIASLENDILKATLVPNAVTYEWQWSKNNDYASEWIGSGLEFPLIKDKYKSNSVGFFVYARFADGSRTGDSNRVVYSATTESIPEPLPNNNDEIIGSLKTDIIDMQNILSKMYSDLDKIIKKDNF